MKQPECWLAGGLAASFLGYLAAWLVGIKYRATTQRVAQLCSIKPTQQPIIFNFMFIFVSLTFLATSDVRSYLKIDELLGCFALLLC